MLDLLKYCCNCFLVSLVKKKFSFSIKKTFRNLSTESHLFMALEFIFILKQIFCLSKKPRSNYFFKLVSLQVLSQQIFSVNKLHYVFIFLHPAVFHIFHSQGFSGSRFFRTQVFRVQAFQGPGLQPAARFPTQVLEVA